MIDRRRKNR